jgi:hypothetical protein
VTKVAIAHPARSSAEKLLSGARQAVGTAVTVEPSTGKKAGRIALSIVDEGETLSMTCEVMQKSELTGAFT